MAGDSDVRFGEFLLRRGQARLERGDAVVSLQPKVFDALVLFVAERGELLTKERLLAELWPGVVVGEEALTQLIRKLRQALDDDPRTPRYVETVMKRGYRFIATVEAVGIDSTRASAAVDAPVPTASASAPSDARPLIATPPPPTQATAAHPVRHTPGRKLLAGLLLLLLAGAIAISASRRRPPVETWRSSRLTAQPEREQEAVFSPDGRSYAFEANVDGQFDLFLASFAGGRRIRLTQTPEADEYYPQFSADGETITFSRAAIAGGPPALWSIPVLGGEERLVLADASYGAVSPDGGRLAFIRYLRDGRFALWVREVASGSEREWMHRDEWLGSVAWSPDGERVAFATPTSVWTIGADGTGAAQVASGFEGVRTVAWSSDGSTLVHDGAAADGLARIWQLPLSEGKSRIVPSPDAAWHPSTSRDGRRLLITVEHKTRQLWRVRADGSGFTPLPLPTTAECFDVDPRNERLAVNDWEASPRSSPIELVELASGSTRVLGDGLCPAFSPQGDRVAYLRSRGDTTDLVVHDLGSGTSRVVAADFGEPGFVEANLDRRPAWSPDGSRLLIEGLESSGRALLEVEIATAARRPLLTGEFGPAAYGADGNSIVVCGATPIGSGLHLLDARSGSARLLARECSYRAAPAFGPTDESVVFLSGERQHPAIIAVDFEGRPLPDRTPLVPPADPAFWGVFDARPVAGGGWVVLSERYEGDLFVLSR